MGAKLSIDAHGPSNAVAEVAGCDPRLVCLPIWTQHEPTRWHTNPHTLKLESSKFHQRLVAECYMPRDDSGRQWLVREVEA